MQNSLTLCSWRNGLRSVDEVVYVFPRTQVRCCQRLALRPLQINLYSGPAFPFPKTRAGVRLIRTIGLYDTMHACSIHRVSSYLRGIIVQRFSRIEKQSRKLLTMHLNSQESEITSYAVILELSGHSQLDFSFPSTARRL